MCLLVNRDFPGGAVVKNLPANAGDAKEKVQPLGQEDPLEGMATHSNILAWKIHRQSSLAGYSLGYKMLHTLVSQQQQNNPVVSCQNKYDYTLRCCL